METRTCSKCGDSKNAESDFYPYRRGTCKDCIRLANRTRLKDPEVKARKSAQMRKRWAEDEEYRSHHYAWRREKYATDPEFRQRQKASQVPYQELSEEKKERKREITRKASSSPEFKAHRKIYHAERSKRPEQKQKVSKRKKERMKEDVNFRLSSQLRSRIASALRGQTKSGSFVRDLGCSIDELKRHLESKFQEGMTWENWGNGDDKWNIDHFIPLAAFDLTDRQHFVLANHYTNLRPLWYKENLSKNKKYPDLSEGWSD